MPSARLLPRTASRRFIPLALTIALAALLVSLTATETGSACGGPPPKPLRALYTESDLVVVGSLGETAPAEVFSPERNYKIFLMRSDLHVSSTVKGEGNHAKLAFYHIKWQMDGELERPEAYTADSEDAANLLYFLKRREGGEGYELADRSYGVKRLSDADLRVYVERMEELALILQEKEPDPARIVEWLVRCAEERATRWEGVYELSTSKYVSELPEPEEEETAEAEKEPGEAAAEEGAGEAAHDEKAERPAEAEDAVKQPAWLFSRRESFYGPNPALVKLLTDAQKKRLADALFNTKRVTEEDAELIALVAAWDDPRFVSFALAQLRGFTDEPPYVTETLVIALARKLGDAGLIKLAEKYSENNTYYDEPEESADEARDEAAAAEEEEPSEAADAGEDSKEEAEEDPAERAFEESLAGTSAQKRSQRLQRFIARAEVALAQKGD